LSFATTVRTKFGEIRADTDSGSVFLLDFIGDRHLAPISDDCYPGLNGALRPNDLIESFLFKEILMKKIFTQLMFGLCATAFFCTASVANAADKGTAEQAVALTKKAVEAVKKEGQEKAFAQFNDPKGAFVQGDLYVMCYDMEGNNKCHGGNAKLIGKNLLEIKDKNGVFIVQELIKTAKSKEGKGWVDYVWVNTVTKAIEPKSTYVEKVGDILVGVGIYK
jgi:cytochrome c